MKVRVYSCINNGYLIVNTLTDGGLFDQAPEQPYQQVQGNVPFLDQQATGRTDIYQRSY